MGSRTGQSMALSIAAVLALLSTVLPSANGAKAQAVPVHVWRVPRAIQFCQKHPSPNGPHLVTRRISVKGFYRTFVTPGPMPVGPITGGPKPGPPEEHGDLFTIRLTQAEVYRPPAGVAGLLVIGPSFKSKKPVIPITRWVIVRGTLVCGSFTQPPDYTMYDEHLLEISWKAAPDG